jgi:Peptidase family S41
VIPESLVNRRLTIVWFVWLLPFAVSSPANAQQFQVDPWMEDFHQLLSEVSTHYVNFEWVANERRVNLPKLKAATEDRLRQAKSDEDARRAFERFLKSFGDAHVEIRWKPKSSASSADQKSSFCERLGYNQEDQNGGIDWSIFPEYTPLQDADAADFPGGILQLRGKKVGVVRIGLFSEHAHPGLCEQAQKDLHISEDAKCNDKCEDDFELAVANLLTAALERRLESLARARAQSLLVDITGNGGGTNWVEPAARVFTPIPLKSPRLGFVKHEHWTHQLQDELRDVESDLQHAPAADRALLTSAAETLRAMIAQTSVPCDRMVLWMSSPTELHCSQVVIGPIYTSGMLPYARDGMFSTLHSQPVLFSPAQYRYHEGINRLPVTVLVDGDTASSAEYFAAMLQDNKAARLVGQLTVGAGCGFTNGGIPTVLKHSGARVRLPDCMRLRADGTDEVSGITPDILLPWADRDSRYQQALKLKRWLEGPDAFPSLENAATSVHAQSSE